MKAVILMKLVRGGGVSAVMLSLCAGQSEAYPRYSENRDSTNCRACHGDFRSSAYISLSDGQNWGNLHNLHRFDMLGGDCDTCHTSPSQRFPVLTNSSAGGVGFDPISCVGCHGRDEDTNPGAALRQHHWNTGIFICRGCHFDADPANYTPVGEDVPPPYYFTPDPNHPTKPTDPCNPRGQEDYAGDPEGLDNDGDDSYDGNDPDCGAVLLGDMDCNGIVNEADIPNFITALIDPANFPPGCDILNGDMDGSGTVNGMDAQGFVDALTH